MYNRQPGILKSITPHRARKSILSVAITKDLNTKGNSNLAGYFWTCRVTPGGGLDVLMIVPMGGRTLTPNTHIRRYLRPGLTMANLSQVVANMLFIGNKLVQWHTQVEALAEKFESLKTLDTAEIVRLEEESGHTCVYFNMTLDDIDFWSGVYLALATEKESN